MKSLDSVVRVGISDIQFVQAPDKIKTSGLGSCVGIILYDEVTKIAGLAHIMLPDSTQATQKKITPAKYADTAIASLIQGLLKRGVPFFRIKAKMAGGAQMFINSYTTNVMRIGPRNVEAVQTILATNKIPIIAEDVGGHQGRTIEFDPLYGTLTIRNVRKKEYTI